MDELVQEFGDMKGRDIFIKAWLTDFFWLDTFNATGVVHVLEDGIRVRALGKKFASFKPDTPFFVNVSEHIGVLLFYLFWNI